MAIIDANLTLPKKLDNLETKTKKKVLFFRKQQFSDMNRPKLSSKKYFSFDVLSTLNIKVIKLNLLG